MAVLFTGGVPQSGKSLFVSYLLPELEPGFDEIINLNPKDYLPKDYRNLNCTKSSQYNIAAWEVCLEELDRQIWSTDDRTLIIFDTTASKSDYVRQLFLKARQGGHQVIYILLDAFLDNIRNNLGDDFIGDEIMAKYQSQLKTTIPILKSLSDRSFQVKNNGSKSDLKELAIDIGKMIKAGNLIHVTDD